ncbi:MAG: FABP family protein [Brachybacterium sp.]|nr:FABP family protein [Brachybacterium sp.]
MPITLDADLDPALYPLAWLIGSWSGEGAAQVPGADGELVGRRIRQHLDATADGTELRWTQRTWVLDAPPPVPPTAALSEEGRAAQEQADAAAAAVGSERELLLEETGTWTVGEPLPGQDLQAARTAKPGSPEATISFALEARFTDQDGTVESYVGEVRGPRIQLACQDVTPVGADTHIAARRMFGLVGGRLMWVLDRMPADGEMDSYLSVELDRG